MEGDFNIQLDDFVYSYPDVDDPRFQTLISAKEEFRELSTLPREPTPKRGEFFKHQKMIHRYMLMYDKLLLTHRTGTGKSCAIGGTSEFFKEALIHATADIFSRYILPQRTSIKKAVILVRGKVLIEEFKREIICKCSQPGVYDTEAIRKAENVTALRGAVTREINKFYEITTYGAFAKKIYQSGFTDDEALKREYSGTLFIIDEVHNIIVDTDKPGKGNSVGKRKGKGDKSGKKITYDTLHRLFHAVDRSKIILASATPMVNSPEEIVSIMNLLLPLNRQMPFPAPTQEIEKINSDGVIELIETSLTEEGGYDYTSPQLEDLEPYFRGLISYVREFDTSTVVHTIGKLINSIIKIGKREYSSQQTIFASPMSNTNDGMLFGPDGQPFLGQEYYYNLATAEGSDEKDVAHKREQQAATFVFPDGSFDKANGFNKYVETKFRPSQRKIKGEIRDVVAGYQPSPELAKWLYPQAPVPNPLPNETPEQTAYRHYQETKELRLHYIGMLSTKFAEVIRLIDDPKNDGKSSFCYTPFVEAGGGSLLAMCFEALGYEIFDITAPVFGKESGSGSGKISFCPAVRDNYDEFTIPVDRPSRIPKRKRIALFTGKTPDNLKTNTLETFNSPENRHGDYIKVLIVSRVGREGINTANVQSIHIVGPEWNQASIYQAISRVIRATSHLNLLAEKRQQMALEGRNPDDAVIDINLYQHAAVTSKGTSNDIYMYLTVEKKDIEIKGVERIMKQTAIDCHLHRARNIRPDVDQDYTPMCDYDVCDYKCSQPAPDFVEYDSYDVLYSEPIINSLVTELKELFRGTFLISLVELYGIFSDIRRKFVDMAVEKIATQKIKLVDRFGNTCYCREDHGTVFIQRDFPLVSTFNQQDDSSLSYYSKNLIAIESKPISQYQPDVGIQMQRQLFDTIYNMKAYEMNNLQNLVKELDVDTLILLVERLIEEYIKGDGSHGHILTGLMGLYHYYIFQVPEPRLTIEDVKIKLTTSGGAGRRTKGGKIKTVEVEMKDTPESNLESRQVYYHTLHSIKSKGEKYTKIIDFFQVRGKIRLLHSGEDDMRWRDANPAEQLVYTKISQDRLETEKSKFEQNDIYGIYTRDDGVLRIIDMGSYREKLRAGEKETKKIQPTGIKCSDLKIPEQINILYRMGERPFPGMQISSDLTKEQLVTKIKMNSKMTEPELMEKPIEELQFIDTLLKRSRVSLCEFIEDALRKRNAVWEI